MKKTSTDIWHDVEYNRDQEKSRSINWWYSEDEVRVLKAKIEEANKILDEKGANDYYNLERRLRTLKKTLSGNEIK